MTYDQLTKPTRERLAQEHLAATTLPLFGGVLVRENRLSGSYEWKWQTGERGRVSDLGHSNIEQMLERPFCAVLYEETGQAPLNDVTWIVMVRGSTLTKPVLVPVGCFRRTLGGAVVGAAWPAEMWPEIRETAESLGWSPDWEPH